MSIDKHLEPLTRLLASALEPVAAQVYFAPECHEAYEKLGFSPSPGQLDNGVQLPDGPAYFTSRGSVMGQVPGEVVAAAFAVFNPETVARSVRHGWELTDAVTICTARTEGATAQLERILGAQPEGFAARHRTVDPCDLATAPRREASLRRVVAPRTARDAARRYVAADRPPARVPRRLAHGRVDFERVQGSRGRPAVRAVLGHPAPHLRALAAWSRDQLDVAEAHLREHGLIDDGGFTDFGRTVRENIEVATDRQCTVMVRSLGDEFDELIAQLTTWGGAIRAAAGYPATGPQNLAPR